MHAQKRVVKTLPGLAVKNSDWLILLIVSFSCLSRVIKKRKKNTQCARMPSTRIYTFIEGEALRLRRLVDAAAH